MKKNGGERTAILASSRRRKDAQDAAALEVPVVPMYIQEKVHPQALVENLRDTRKLFKRDPSSQALASFDPIRYGDEVLKVFAV